MICSFLVILVCKRNTRKLNPFFANRISCYHQCSLLLLFIAISTFFCYKYHLKIWIIYSVERQHVISHQTFFLFSSTNHLFLARRKATFHPRHRKLVRHQNKERHPLKVNEVFRVIVHVFHL